jgi:hypothetical protein
MEIKLMAVNNRCNAKVAKTINIVESIPWNNSAAIGASALVVEAAVIQLTAFYSLAAKGGASALQQSGVQGNIWLALAGYLDRKKRRSLGIVYDSVTKKPITRAVVRLFDVKKGRTVDTAVTDAKGIMRLVAHPGEYLITVSHPQYKFPSTLVNGEIDGGYAQIYLGKNIKIESSSQPIMVSVPLDPVVLSGLQKTKVRFAANVEKLGNYGSIGLFTAGFLYSLYAAVVYPHLFNYLALSLYVLLLSAKLLLFLAKPKATGVMRTSDGKPVEGLEVGLFDVEFKNLLYRTFTTKEGRYNFAVSNGSYYLKIMDEHYAIENAGQLQRALYIEPATAKDNVRVIAQDLILKRQ